MNVTMGVTIEADSLTEVDGVLQHTHYTSIPNLKIWGLGTDSLIANGNTSVSKLQMPLKKDVDQCAFVFNYYGVNDTLIFDYTRDVQLISMTCGCAVLANITQIHTQSALLIDSIRILNAAVSTIREDNVTIYIHKP